MLGRGGLHGREPKFLGSEGESQRRVPEERQDRGRVPREGWVARIKRDSARGRCLGKEELHLKPPGVG